MKSTIHLLTVLLLFFGAASIAGADSNLKIATANMAQLYENYHRAVDAQAKFQSAVEDAQSQGESMMAEGNALVEEYRGLMEEAENPALSDDARDRARERAETKLATIREKEREVQQFQVNTQRMLEQRQRSHRQLLLDEIREVVNTIASDNGATLVLDSSGQSALGIPTVIYADSSFDITDKALAELNKDQPGQ